jgi:ribosomal protein S27E
METYECQNCGWILATFVPGDSASCQRCGGSRMRPAEKNPSWTVVRCACGHKDVYARPVSGVKCPNCHRTIGVKSGGGSVIKAVVVLTIVAIIGLAVWWIAR